MQVERERDKERLDMKRRIDQLKRTTEEETEEAKKKVNNTMLRSWLAADFSHSDCVSVSIRLTQDAYNFSNIRFITTYIIEGQSP